jgi:RecA-family ATPase
MTIILSESAQKSSEILRHALYFAGTNGWHTFPVPPGTKAGYSDLKQEITDRPWGASSDQDVVRTMFDLHPEANVGVRTGEVSGFFVVETDTIAGGHAHDGAPSLAAIEEIYAPLPPTLQAESPSGSIHSYFRWPGVYIKSTANELAPGVDVKGDGGMVLAPPSVKPGVGVYRWRNLLPIADAPPWLLTLIMASEHTDLSRVGTARDAPVGLRPVDGSAAAGHLKAACATVVAAEDGKKNNILNTQAFFVGRYVGNGEIGYDVAFHDLLAACEGWDNESKTKGTIKSGLNAGAKHPAQTAAEMFAGVAQSIASPPPVPDLPDAMRVISAASFAGKPVPEREMLVEGLIPARIAAGLYGEGAVGKSLLALMLAVACVIGALWLGRRVKQGPVIYLCCEDDEDEVHRRLAAICRFLQIDLATLGDLFIVPLADEDAVLAATDGRSSVLTTTYRYEQVVELAQRVRPALVIGDTLADILAATENDRMIAKQFVRKMRPLAVPYGGTFLVLAHPSLSGINTGRGTSGSTGWRNTFRWDGYLRKVLDENGREPDPSNRVLSVMKANYGPQDGEIPLRYVQGCYMVDTTRLTGGGDPLATAAKAERVFLELLKKYIGQNRHVSTSEGKSYAPFVFAADAAKEGVNKAALKAAMERLLDAKKIENAPHGAPSKKMFRLYVNA